ncbi:MAG: Crp/Fnr family transcriptional regulator [Terracidiphilus sp.]
MAAELAGGRADVHFRFSRRRNHCWFFENEKTKTDQYGTDRCILSGEVLRKLELCVRFSAVLERLSRACIDRIVTSRGAGGTRIRMMNGKQTCFDPAVYLTQAGLGRKIVHVKPRRAFFAQGDVADCLFYLQSGRVKLTVISKTGKEATIALLGANDFVGEESMAGTPGLRMATATALSSCTALKIEREVMIRALREEHALSEVFLKFLLARSMRTQADLVDQLFNSSEKRLARILLLMAEYGESGAEQTLIPKISQETLAEMIGTTRSRVSFFMNRFRKLGLIEYNGGIHVHKSLLNVILHD